MNWKTNSYVQSFLKLKFSCKIVFILTIVFIITFILGPCHFCGIWALCVITYYHLHYAPCLACCAFFGSLVPAMCNRTWSAQVHEISESQCDDSQEFTLLFQLLVYYVHLISVIQLSVILYKDFVMILVIFSREGKNLNHTSFMFIDFLFNFSFFSFFYFKGETLYNSFVTEDKM